MCEINALRECFDAKRLYYPPTYSQDGFIHATAVPAMLLVVANHFYQDSKGEWVCLEINPHLLGARVKYEAAAPVGNKASMKNESDENAPLFPHIYGGLPKVAITKMFKIIRNEDGQFLSIDGLVAPQPTNESS
jgi:uncharacterized protein (DUF952 family)